MSYNIGQLRSTSIENFITPVTLGTPTEFERSSNISGDGTIFKDIEIQVSGKLLNQNNYYFYFQIKKRLDSQQNVILKLRKNQSQLSQASYQTIKTVSLDNDNSDYIRFQALISPNADYDYIILELDRVLIDYQKNEVSSTSTAKGRILQVGELSLFKIQNLVSGYLNQTYPTLKSLTKVGIQGRSGLLMCINGEQIRIGKSGVYEINNGMKISSLGFIPTQNDFFLVDFEY